MPIPFLQEFEARFQEIDKSKEPFRTKRLSVLLTDMEQVYGITVTNIKKFEKHNPNTMALYKKVSAARGKEGKAK